MRSHGTCHHASSLKNAASLNAACPCDSCELTLAVATAKTHALDIGFEPAPQFTYVQEFYGPPLPQADAQAQPQRAPPIYSLQHMRILGSRMTSKLHHWASAVWPL